jgi:hypothetical protein
MRSPELQAAATALRAAARGLEGLAAAHDRGVESAAAAADGIAEAWGSSLAERVTTVAARVVADGRRVPVALGRASSKVATLAATAGNLADDLAYQERQEEQAQR